jgi:hypothetical protein
LPSIQSLSPASSTSPSPVRSQAAAGPSSPMRGGIGTAVGHEAVSVSPDSSPIRPHIAGAPVVPPPAPGGQPGPTRSNR